jgi:hypothetical protein
MLNDEAKEERQNPHLSLPHIIRQMPKSHQTSLDFDSEA